LLLELIVVIAVIPGFSRAPSERIKTRTCARAGGDMTADAYVLSELTEEQQELLPFRARGLDEMKKRLGDIVALVRDGIEKRGKVKVLEVGCGFGLVLGELQKLIGDSIEIIGLNKVPRHGGRETMKKILVERGVYAKEEICPATLPKIFYHDVNRGFPFPDGEFDFLVSQVTLMHIEEKAKFIEEAHRVLSADGVARIDVCLDRSKLPYEYGTSFEIHENGSKISFWDYMSRFACLRRGRASERDYLEIRKTGAPLQLGLKLASAQNLNKIDSSWHGRRSILSSAGLSPVQL
jgi:SAM-dependent methyltransferase